MVKTTIYLTRSVIMTRYHKKTGSSLLIAALLAIISLGGLTGCEPSPDRSRNSDSYYCNSMDYDLSGYYIDWCSDRWR